jgi:predicted alpha/beta superfamily hydrolase
MTGNLSRIFVVLAGLTFLAAFACAAQTVETKSLPKVTIANSEVRTIKSALTGRDYDLLIHVPADYAKDKTKKYPVLYILDGEWDFKLTDSILGGLIYDKFMPDIILVGISYPGENPDYNTLRAMDLTPTPVSSVQGSGGAPKFLKSIKTELIPLIESNYRVDASHRYLQGCSYAGLFTLYAMFSDPGYFNGYISSSPAVPYDNGFAFRQEAEYFRTHKELNTKLFIGVGGSEKLTEPVKRFMQTIESRGYKGLKLQTRVVEGEAHSSNKPETYNRGLRFLFSE